MATDPRINYAPRQGGNIPQMTPAPSWNMPQLRAFSPTAQNWEAGGHFVAQLIDAIAEARREDAEKERIAYISKREAAYDTLPNQLDLLWHAIDADADLKVKFASFYNSIKAVKDANPKP